MKSLSKFFGVLALVAWAGSANAALMNFSYIFDEFTSIEGMIDGTVGEDLDTLTVNDVMATVTSTGGFFGVDSFSFDTSLGGFHISGDSDTDPGTLSLTGLFFDLAVITLPESNACLGAPGFCLIGSASYVTFPGAGGTLFSLNPQNFQIAAKPVPEPPTLALLGVAALLAGRFGSRKRKARAA